MRAPPFKKEVLLEDELGRGFAAVVKYGPHLFVAGSNGFRDPETERIDSELTWQAEAQCRNAYGRIVKRLEKAGYGGNCAVWIENFTSGQEWRLPRMGLWPEYFGEREHGWAVSFGAQTKMNGINMITTVCMALTPDLERIVGVEQPHRGRASRVTKCGDFIYVIGVRGRENPFSGEIAPEETPDAFRPQLRNCLDRLKAHLQTLDSDVDQFVRLDACLRDVNRAPEYWSTGREYSGGKIPWAGYAVGCPLGGRLEQEVGGVAVAPGVAKEVAWFDQRPELAQAVKGACLVFASGCLGSKDLSGQRTLPELAGDKVGQTRQAFRRLEAALARFDLGLEAVCRLDVFVRDIYFEDAFYRLARDVFGPSPPAISVVGAELEGIGEVELVAIAGA